MNTSHLISDNGWLVLALLPFISFIIMLGWLAVYTRNGRPLTLKLRALGVNIEVDTHNTERKVVSNHE